MVSRYSTMRGARTAVLLVLAAMVPGVLSCASTALASKQHRISPALDFGMGAVSGCTASLMVFPIDLAKTRSFPESSLPRRHPSGYALPDLHPSRDSKR